MEIKRVSYFFVTFIEAALFIFKSGQLRAEMRIWRINVLYFRLISMRIEMYQQMLLKLRNRNLLKKKSARVPVPWLTSERYFLYVPYYGKG
jgi:hypothetical protein